MSCKLPRFALIAFVALAASQAMLHAADPERAAPLEYRRYFVPAERPQDWPKGNVSYLPVDADEFERLVEAANSVPLGKTAAGAARVTKAVYQAVLDAPDHLAGEARFEISAPPNAPVLLPLDPLGFVVEGAVWERSPDTPAAIGMDAQQRFSILVERPGTLVLRWSLAGHREASGLLQFALHLPGAPVAKMQLDLPPGIVPALGTAVLAEDASAGNRHRWEFELGGRTAATLVLAPDEAQSRHRRVTLLQQHSDYRFTPGGLEVSAQLRLDIYHEPLRRLELDLDGDLRLVAAQQGSTQLRWSNLEGQADAASRPVLEFDEPLLGPGRLVTVTAIAPLVLNQSWTLPRLRVQGALWQEGSASLTVPAPLSLDQLLPLRCRQSNSGPLASARPSDTFDLQFFSPDASAKVLFTWRKPLARLAAATRVELSADAWQADFHGQFTLQEGEIFVLSADMAEDWLVDSVVSVPPGAISTWSVEETAIARTLVVQLVEPLSPSRPIALRIGARRAAAIDEPLTEAALRTVEFNEAALIDGLLALAPDGPYRLFFNGIEQPRLLRFEDLTPGQQKLIGISSSDAWIDLNAVQPRWTAALRPQAPSYSAEILVDATLNEQRLFETCAIRCKPEGAKLDRLVVHFSEARAAEPRWKLEKDLGPFTVHRITSPSSATPALAAGAKANHGETWELRFVRSTEKPFDVRAERETSWDEKVAVGLVALDGAASQQGSVCIRADGAFGEIVASHRLTPVPLESVAFDDGQPADHAPEIAAYRYEPLLELGAPPLPIEIRRSPRTFRGAVVWKLQLRSEYSASGRVLHTAQLDLQNKGQRECSFRLPADVEMLSARIDGEELVVQRHDDRRTILLPPDEDFVVLSIDYASTARPLRLIGCCQAVWPQIEVPVISRSWTIDAPPPYAPCDDLAAAGQLDWRQRLFGPLGRAASDEWFDPRGNDLGRLLAASAPSSETSSEGIEWNRYRMALDEEPALAWFVHRDAVAVARWAIVAIVAGLGLSCRRRWPASLVVVGGLAAIAALWLPSPLAALASGVWLGVVVALVGQLWFSTRGRLPSKATPVDDPSASVQPETVGAVLCLIMITLGPNCVADDDAPAAPLRADAAETKHDTIHRVLIPVDAQQKPGSRYQVPTELLQALRRYAGTSHEPPRGWLLTDARYECRLGNDEDEPRIDVAELSVEYRLRVFDSDAQVRIPLMREQAAVVADSATLDRQPIELSWDEVGGALVCDIDQPGDYPLRFRLVPKTIDQQEVSGFDLAIPRVASSRLDITARGPATPLEVRGARGATRTAADGRRLSVELGPTERLEVRWPLRLSTEAPVAEVEEMLWLKVHPGSVVLDARLNFKVSQGVMRRIDLAIDHRLWRIPGGEPSLPAFTERTPPGDPLTSSSPQLVQFDLKSPVRDQLALNLSWLLTGSSGVGNLRLPALQVLGARTVKRWLAVTVDAGLEYDIHNGERLEGLPSADFAAAWGGPDTTALRDALAYRLTDAETAWSLATRPREPQTTVKEDLALSFDRAGAAFEYDAQLRTTAGFVFAHRLRVPEELQIDHVSLEEEGVERAARWGRGESGVLTVFLNRRVTGPQRLLLHGRLPLPHDGRLPLPAVTIEPGDSDVTTERAEVLSRNIRIYRQPSVVVAVSGVTGMSKAERAEGDSSSGPLGRLVASYTAPGDFAAILTVAPNEPTIHSAVQLTSLDYFDRSWTAQCDVRFTVGDGVLDAVRFEVPAGWSGPFEVSPPGAIEWLSPPGTERKQLLVRPHEPFDGPVSLTLQAPLKWTAGESIAAPDIMALLPSIERFVALPLHVGLEPVSWDTARLVASPLPESLASAQPKLASRRPKDRRTSEAPATFAAPETFGLYRAVGESPQAILRVATSSTDTARVRLADIGLSCDDGAWRLVAAFDLDPGGRTTCPLHFDAGWKLLEVWVNGAPAAPLPTDGDPWQLPLHSAHLPQRIEVIAAGPAASHGESQLPPVRLGELPVKETLIAIAAPNDRRPLIEPEMAETYDAAASAQARVTALAALVDLPQEVVATTSRDEMAAWFRPWARRLVEARQAQLRLAPNATAAPRQADLNEQWLAAARRLHAEAVLKSLAASSLRVIQPLTLWSEAHRDRPLSYYRMNRAAAPVTWRYIPPAQLRLRFIDTAIVAAICLVAAAALRHPTFTDAWRRWPQLLVAIAGLLWWLWLQPSALGLLLMALSLWSACRSAWKPAWAHST